MQTWCMMTFGRILLFKSANVLQVKIRKLQEDINKIICFNLNAVTAITAFSIIEIIIAGNCKDIYCIFKKHTCTSSHLD